MRKLAVVLLVLMVAIAVGAQIAEARRFYYYHPAFSTWGWWPYAPPLFYPQVSYAPPAPIVIQQPQPPVVIQQPQIYVQRPPDPQPQEVVWYWCRKPEGFWPHIQRCEGDAWMKVLPSTAPPNAPK